MKNILITGATGNIGSEVISFLIDLGYSGKIIAGVRNTKTLDLPWQSDLVETVKFDFEDPSTFDNALTNVERVFLLRPPQISDVNKYFKPLINKIEEMGIREIMFLSVQGAEKSSIIPHRKIENLILKSSLAYIFLRPSYFMQNLTTTFKVDIQQKRKIFLPAGNAKFNWVDVKNIGEAAAILFEEFEQYKNAAYEITGYENLNFQVVTEMINKEIDGKPIHYDNTNPLSFLIKKLREGQPFGKAMVMLILHYLPRFQEEPNISSFYENISGKEPTSIKEFIKREKEAFEPKN